MWTQESNFSQGLVHQRDSCRFIIEPRDRAMQLDRYLSKNDAMTILENFYPKPDRVVVAAMEDNT